MVGTLWAVSKYESNRRGRKKIESQTNRKNGGKRKERRRDEKEKT